MTARLAALLRHDTAGDPCSGLRWVRRTTRNLADYLTAELNLPVSPRTVARLLREMGYSLRVNRKCQPSTSPAERNSQFEFIARLRQHCACSNTPVISMDSKKKASSAKSVGSKRISPSSSSVLCRRRVAAAPLCRSRRETPAR